jgi:hypothetical protein
VTMLEYVQSKLAVRRNGIFTPFHYGRTVSAMGR